MSFFEKLKRRNVIRVGIAYVVIAWLLSQVAKLALDHVDSHDWMIYIILVMLAFDLPRPLINPPAVTFTLMINVINERIGRSCLM